MIQYLSTKLLKALGWKVVGQMPNAKKYIVIVGPHTSNWDFLVGILARSVLAVKARFLGKHQLFRPPFGWIFRAMGGAPVVRTRENNLVDQVVAMYSQNEEFILALAPEGTRHSLGRWHSGFYHIACKANVDIVMIGLDFKSKEVRIREPFRPSKDIDVDFPIILDYYRGIDGYHAKKIPEYQAGNK